MSDTTKATPPREETARDTSKKRFKLPDIYIILGTFILVMAALTYVIPAGEYERQLVETAKGVQNLVVSGTYKEIEPHPAGWLEIITAIPYGFEKASGAVGGCDYLVAPMLMAAVSIVSAFIGTPELSLAYLPVFLPLFYRLGYDGMTATAVALLGPCMGFIFGITVPASVGIGQQIAQIPMFSGSGLRLVVLVLAVVVSIVYVSFYAARIKKDPTKSLSFETDRELREKILKEAGEDKVFTKRQVAAGAATLVMFPIVIALILMLNLGFEAIGGLFLSVGIIAAAIAGKSAQQICDDINAGMHDLMVGALLCGVAASISVVMDKGLITDTIVYWLEGALSSTPPALTAIAVLWEQSIFNLLIPGATALTILTMPILSPLGTLLDISQQAIVSANAWGGQLTDILFPTSGFFIATLAISKVDYFKWVRFYGPLFVILGIMASAALYLQQVFDVTF